MLGASQMLGAFQIQGSGHETTPVRPWEAGASSWMADPARSSRAVAQLRRQRRTAAREREDARPLEGTGVCLGASRPTSGSAGNGGYSPSSAIASSAMSSSVIASSDIPSSAMPSSDSHSPMRSPATDSRSLQMSQARLARDQRDLGSDVVGLGLGTRPSSLPEHLDDVFLVTPCPSDHPLDERASWLRYRSIVNVPAKSTTASVSVWLRTSAVSSVDIGDTKASSSVRPCRAAFRLPARRGRSASGLRTRPRRRRSGRAREVLGREGLHEALEGGLGRRPAPTPPVPASEVAVRAGLPVSAAMRMRRMDHQ